MGNSDLIINIAKRLTLSTLTWCTYFTHLHLICHGTGTRGLLKKERAFLFDLR